MTRIFLETSVFIRYFTADDKNKFQDCVLLLDSIETIGKLRPYTSNIVVLEILFVLTKIYKFPKREVIEAIQKILEMRNLTLIEKTNTKDALKRYNKHKIKFGDCLISTQIPKGAQLITYDNEFSKVGVANTMTPAEVLKGKTVTIS